MVDWEYEQGIINRLKSIEGHVRGVQRMVGEDAYCIDIINQNLAVQRALEKVNSLDTITLSIPNIGCRHCIMTIERASGLVDGAEFVSGDVAAKTATFQVAGDEALAALKAALAEAGYPVAR